MHYYTYLIIQSKVKLTPTERQQPCTQSHLQARAHMHVRMHPLSTHTWVGPAHLDRKCG